MFGRWCGSAADDVLGKVVEHLQSWPNQRCPKMQALQAEVTSHICVVNACKCIHVLKTLSALETGKLALFPNIDCSWHLICPQELCVSRSLCLDWKSTQVLCMYLFALPAQEFLYYVQLPLAWQPEAIGKGKTSLRLPLKYWLTWAEARCSSFEFSNVKWNPFPLRGNAYKTFPFPMNTFHFVNCLMFRIKRLNRCL